MRTVEGVVIGVVLDSVLVFGLGTLDGLNVFLDSFVDDGEGVFKISDLGLVLFLFFSMVFLSSSKFSFVLGEQSSTLVVHLGVVVDDFVQFSNSGSALSSEDGEDVVFSFDSGSESEVSFNSLFFSRFQILHVVFEFVDQSLDEANDLGDVVSEVLVVVSIVIKVEGSSVVINVAGSDFRFSSGIDVESGIQFLVGHGGGVGFSLSEDSHKVELVQFTQRVFVLVVDDFLQGKENFGLLGDGILESILGHFVLQVSEKFDGISAASELLKIDQSVLASLVVSLLNGVVVSGDLFQSIVVILLVSISFSSLSIDGGLHIVAKVLLDLQLRFFISDLLKEDGFSLGPSGIFSISVVVLGLLESNQDVIDRLDTLVLFGLEKSHDGASEVFRRGHGS